MAKQVFLVPSSPRTVYQNTTVYERRAPTDESVKVLKEYHEKAMKWASDAVFEKLDPINASVGHFEMSMVDDKYHVCININGRKVLMKMDRPYESRYALAKSVCERIAEELTSQLFDMKVLK